MKTLIIIGLILFTTPAFASWCIVNNENVVMSVAEYQPDVADLSSRNEISVLCDKTIPLSEMEYRNGKVIKHVKTTKEKADDAKAVKKSEEENKINQQMRKQAYEALKASGTVFIEIKSEDFK
jgi:hypothetical protein